MRCIIAGSRYVHNYEHVVQAVKASKFPIDVVVSGGANGADQLGEKYALEWSLPVRVFNADWAKHGRAAGPIRNREMAENADALIAIWDGRSRGTKNMIKEASKRNLKIHVHRVDVNWWVSSKRMTFEVVTVDNVIIDSAPIGRKFKGQHLMKFLKWLKKQGGLKVHRYDE